MNNNNQPKFDITKLHSGELFTLAKMVWRDTEGFKLFGVLLAFIGSVFSLGLKVGQWTTPIDSKIVALEEKVKDERFIRQQRDIEIKQKDDDISKLKANSENLNLSEKSQKLEQENQELHLIINKKPSYSTCSNYNGEMQKLREKLDKLEQTILWLANPQPTAEMQQLGITGFTAEQVQAYATQSVAFRPYADRLLSQIKALEVTRQPCD